MMLMATGRIRACLYDRTDVLYELPECSLIYGYLPPPPRINTKRSRYSHSTTFSTFFALLKGCLWPLQNL